MMHWQYTPYILPLLGAAVMNGILAGYAWRQRQVPGARAFAWLMLAVLEWSGGGVLEILSRDLAAKIFWAKLEYVGIASVPPLWLIFALAYTRRERWRTRRKLTLLALLPVLSIGLAATNELHGLFWRRVWAGLALQVQYGPWFWVHAAYSYLLLLIGVSLFIRLFLQSAQLYRRQIGVMVGGAFIPWLANVLYLTGWVHLPVDLTQLAFTLTGMLFAYGLFRFRMFDIAPVARDAVIENMRDGMLVLDAQDRIVDLNAAMQQILGVTADQAIGRPASVVLHPWRDFVQPFQDAAEVQTEITLPQNGKLCSYDVRISPLANKQGLLRGRLIVAHDITDRRQAEQALQESELRFKELAEATAEGIVIHEQGLVLDVNPVVGKLFGYQTAELIGRNLFELIPLAFHEVVAVNLAIEQNHAYEIEGIHKDGTVFPLEVHTRLTPYRGRLARVAAVRDITERKQAEAALRYAHKALQQRVQELAAINRIMQTVAATLDVNTMLAMVAQELLAFFQASSTGVALLDAEQQTLTIFSDYAARPELPSNVGAKILIAANPAFRQVFQERKPVVIPQAQTNPWLQPAQDVLRKRQAQCLMVIPLVARGEVFGVIGIDTDQPGRKFTPAEVTVAETIAGPLAKALENARLFDEERRQRQIAESLRRVATVLSSTLDHAAVLAKIFEQLQQVIPYNSAAIFLQDGADLVLVEGAFVEPRFIGRRLSLAESDLAVAAFQQQTPTVAADVRTDPRWHAWDAQSQVRSWMGAPLFVRDQPIGLLTMDSFTVGAYRTEDAQILQLFANQAALAIQNAQLYQREQERRRLSDTLREAVIIVSSTLEPRRVVGLLLDELQKVVTYHFASVMLVSGNTLTRLVRRNAQGDSYRAMSFPVDAYPLNAETLREKRPILIADVRHDARWKNSRETGEIRSLLNTPLLVQDRPVGILSIGRSDTVVYTTDDANTVFAFAIHVAIALENARLAEQTRATLVDLQDTLERLQRTQKRLIESEKMAALGKLIASIAHEINTPLGAIRAAMTNITHALAATTRQLPALLPQLALADQQAFWTFVARAVQPQPALTTREERQRKRTLCAALATHGIPQAEELADVLGDMGVFDEMTPYLALFQQTQAPGLLQAARDLVMQHRNSETIFTAVERMSKIVFALKTYAHYDAAGQQTTAHVTEGLEVALTLYENQLKHGVTVLRRYADIPAIRCYPDELNQVWTNLIHNAIQAMAGKGTLEITVKSTPSPSQEGKIEYSSQEGKIETPLPSTSSGHRLGGDEGGWIVVQITDSGGGIPESIKGRIFEPFFTTKPAGEGSGLGLDICKKIIDKHQGQITFDSQPGRTTFSVWLPV